MVTPERMTQPCTSESNIMHLSIKPIPFYRTNPKMWIGQLESQFHLANIQNDTTKFHHLLSMLPEDVAINLHFESTSYKDLKEQILKIYMKTKEKLLNEALSTISLDGKKPSLCLNRIRRKLNESGMEKNDDFIRHRLNGALPQQAKIAMAAHTEKGLDEYAQIADTVISVLNDQQQIAGISKDFNETSNYSKENKERQPIQEPYLKESFAYESYPQRNPARFTRKIFPERSTQRFSERSQERFPTQRFSERSQERFPTRRFSEISQERFPTQRFSERSQERFPFRKDNGKDSVHNYPRKELRFANSNYNQHSILKGINQENSKVCFYHMKFGREARKCNSFCEWPAEYKPMSRASSPFPNDYFENDPN